MRTLGLLCLLAACDSSNALEHANARMAYAHIAYDANNALLSIRPFVLTMLSARPNETEKIIEACDHARVGLSTIRGVRFAYEAMKNRRYDSGVGLDVQLAIEHLCFRDAECAMTCRRDWGRLVEELDRLREDARDEGVTLVSLSPRVETPQLPTRGVPPPDRELGYRRIAARVNRAIVVARATVNTILNRNAPRSAVLAACRRTRDILDPLIFDALDDQSIRRPSDQWPLRHLVDLVRMDIAHECHPTRSEDACIEQCAQSWQQLIDRMELLRTAAGRHHVWIEPLVSATGAPSTLRNTAPSFTQPDSAILDNSAHVQPTEACGNDSHGDRAATPGAAL